VGPTWHPTPGRFAKNNAGHNANAVPIYSIRPQVGFVNTPADRNGAIFLINLTARAQANIRYQQNIWSIYGRQQMNSAVA
jgi:hypothetical protein